MSHLASGMASSDVSCDGPALLQASVPDPCAVCHRAELLHLMEQYRSSFTTDYVVLSVPVQSYCSRCGPPVCRSFCCPTGESQFVQVPIPLEMYSYVERAQASAFTCVKEPTSRFGWWNTSRSDIRKANVLRAYQVFVQYLGRYETSNMTKLSVLTWLPHAMTMYSSSIRGARRTFRLAVPDTSQGETASSAGDSGPGGGSPKDDSNPKGGPKDEFSTNDEVGNPDVHDGRLLATQLIGNEYGEEDRVKYDPNIVRDDKFVATRIGPDLGPVEAFSTTGPNAQAAVKKRISPPTPNISTKLRKTIDRTVKKLCKTVFSEDRIRAWRAENPNFEDMSSKKWSAERWRNTVATVLGESDPHIEQSTQIKENEVLPAAGKAPRLIINCGDKSQVMMKLLIKCVEENMFDYYEEASIKHVPKHDAMKRIANRLYQTKGCNIIEGDGSAWDACCNSEIRGLIENQVCEHVAWVLGNDVEVPKGWLDDTLRDMRKKRFGAFLKGKDQPIRLDFDAIRQSGHAGTSCLNWLTNFICWLCVLCEEPWKMICKDKKGRLPWTYISRIDHKKHILQYAFEGDDSILATSEDVHNERFQKHVFTEWKSLGFKMKLVLQGQECTWWKPSNPSDEHPYVDKFKHGYATFTGFDFLVGPKGLKDCYLPEIKRNIASSSWTTSRLVLDKPSTAHDIAAAAYLSRALNFDSYPPLRNYFAQLGKSHALKTADRPIDEPEAINLGIAATNSVIESLDSCLSSTTTDVCRDMAELVYRTTGFYDIQRESNLYCCTISDPLDTQAVKFILPEEFWPARKHKPRRGCALSGVVGPITGCGQ